MSISFSGSAPTTYFVITKVMSFQVGILQVLKIYDAFCCFDLLERLRYRSEFMDRCFVRLLEVISAGGS